METFSVNWDKTVMYTLDFSEFNSLRGNACEYLDFSYNYLTYVYKPSNDSFCPNLKLLDLSHNRLIQLGNTFADYVRDNLRFTSIYKSLWIVSLAGQEQNYDRVLRPETIEDSNVDMPLLRLSIDFLPFLFDIYIREPIQIVDNLPHFQDARAYALKSHLENVIYKAN